MSTAILLCNMGGPDSLESVHPYLKEIFLDPDLIQIPIRGRLREKLAEFLAGKRAPKSRKIFQAIGGSSPLLNITQDQADRLQQRLQSNNPECRVFPAMRYWHPFIEEVWQRLHDDGFRSVVIVSMYPFYSHSTTGSIVRLVKELQARLPMQRLEIIDRFGDSDMFIEAMAEQIREAVSNAHTEAPFHVLLSAHSLPLRQIKKGDPYEKEILRAMDALQHKLSPDVQLHLSYQSKIGPVKWLGPSTEDKIQILSTTLKELWVYPFGFVADNSETLYEIGQLYKKSALENGLEFYHRIEALNDHDMFMNALERLITEKVRTE